MNLHDRSSGILSGFLLLCALACSCAPAYTPNALHIPLYTNKGEVHAAAYLGTSGFDAHTSYSPEQNYSISAAVSYQSNIDTLYTSRRTMGELAVGYYATIERVGRIDLMAGFGTGTAHSSIREERKLQAFGRGWLKEFSGRFNRYFLQASVGLPLENLIAMKGMKQTETGVAVRSTLVHFYQVDSSSSYPSYIDNGFIEPVFFARTGWENVKVEIQAGVCFPLTRKISYDWQLLHLAAGFHLTFGRTYEPPPKEPTVDDPLPQPWVDAARKVEETE